MDLIANSRLIQKRQPRRKMVKRFKQALYQNNNNIQIVNKHINQFLTSLVIKTMHTKAKISQLSIH